MLLMLRSSARLLRRVAVTVVGVVILAIGAVLLVAPGPGFLVIGLGLFTLSLEYDWAHRRLDYVRQRAAELAALAVARPLSTVASTLGALGLVAAGLVCGLVEEVPFSGWWTGGSLIAGGLIALATIVASLVQARRLPPAVPDQRREVSGAAPVTAPAPAPAAEPVSPSCPSG